MAVKLIKRGDISLHTRDALVIATSDALSEPVLKALSDRYGVSSDGQCVLLQWNGYLNNLDKWVPGTLMAQKLGPKQDQTVIFCCMADRGQKASYPYIRDCMRKLAKKQKELGITSVSMLFVGCNGNPDVNKIALEPVIAAAVGDDLHVDLYEEFSAGVQS